ncbi:hypothetical protein BKN38_01115 [Helicobacter sp. CLO-3]|uniref:hypothetical protein n=1 Tax=unclassified Helicobacter TaxID=2593540 RepID=UPI0008053F78|nr:MULTISPECIES: hypothetical protein [unclassified Helicobacter]OBV29510.1 hypothetical protein BA723_05255 [Helicobacter sp. CLO-3]OHU85645.1 hypothetical protein BKN38_01115 [Helicobacter sp. CLO-3]
MQATQAQTTRTERAPARAKDLQTKDYSKYSAKRLQSMLNTKQAKVEKLQAEIKILKLEQNLVKNALTKRKTPSKELLQAIKEVENGEVSTYESIEAMMSDIR